MGTIVDKFNYSFEAKDLIKDSINNLGGSITSETELKEYAQELDNIYNNIPKTTDTGTNLSLNTIKGKMNIIPKGDTKQDSATGSNLMNTEKLVNGTYNGLTITKDSDDFINISGTATANTSIVLSEITYNFPSALYISYENTFVTNTAQLTFFNGSTTLGGLTFSGANRTYNMSTILGDKTCTRIELYVANGNTINGKFRPMLNTQSGQTYSKYAFPNPSFPSDIEVVRGKNRFDGQLELGTYSNSGAKDTSTINYRNKVIIPVQPNKTYTFSINGVSQKYAIYYYNKSQTFLSSEGLSTGTFTTPNDCYYINFRCFNADFTSDFASLKIQLEQGSQATSYLPYNTIEVKVENKNLLKFKQAKEVTTGGVTIKFDDNTTLTLNGTSNGQVAWGCELEPLKLVGTYKASGYTRDDNFVDLYWKDKNGRIQFAHLKNNPTITFNEGDTLYQIFVYIVSGTTVTFNNETFNLQLEKRKCSNTIYTTPRTNTNSKSRRYRTM